MHILRAIKIVIQIINRKNEHYLSKIIRWTWRNENKIFLSWPNSQGKIQTLKSQKWLAISRSIKMEEKIRFSVNKQKQINLGYKTDGIESKKKHDWSINTLINSEVWSGEKRALKLDQKAKRVSLK